MKKIIVSALLSGLSLAALADVNVGVTLSATGPAASLGIPEKNTIDLLPKTVAGQKVNYIVLDDASDTTTAVKNLRKLISEDKVGPEYSDLLLVGIYLDLRRASNSLAVLRDKTNQKRYKLRVGDRLGRLKVAQIRQKDVVFIVEDFGFERQETLSLTKREEETP